MRNDVPAYLIKRPALKLAVLTITGLLIGHSLDVSPVVLLFTLITFSIAAIFLLCVNNSLSNCFLIVTFVLTGFLSYEIATRVFPSHHIINFVDSSESVAITGTVVGFPHQKDDHIEIELATKEIIRGTVRQATQGKILVRIWLDNFFPGYGEQVQICGKLSEPRGERNPGDFDYKKFVAAYGIYGIMNIYTPEKITIIPSPPPKSITYFIYLIKHKFYFSIEKLYPGKARAIMKALLLGIGGKFHPS